MNMIRRISLALLSLTLASHAFAREEFTKTFEKTIPLRSGQRILLEHHFGDIVVRTHPQGEAGIRAEIRVSAADLDQAKAYADKVEIRVENASELSIRTRYPDAGQSMLGFHWKNVSFSVHYEVVVPENTPVNIRNAFGGVAISGIKADCDVTTSHGDLAFTDGRGTQRLQNSFASIEVRHNAGNVSVDNSNGAVDASDITGSLTLRDRFASLNLARVANGLEVTNSNGAIDVSDSGGSGVIHNSFGSVTVRNFRGDLSVGNSNGKVDVSNVDGSANLRSSFGDISFAGIKGQVTVRGNNAKIDGSKVGGSLSAVNSFGAVDIAGVQHDVHVESGNGAVRLAQIGGNAQVKTSFGTVNAETIGGKLSVEDANGSVKASQMKGAAISTSFGSVTLDQVSGPLQIENQNGSVDASRSTRGACEPIAIHTSFSALRVHLEPDASYQVSARTSFGHIRSEFPLTVSGSMSSDGLSGVIGTGKCEMRLTNSNGAIEILKSSQ